MNEDGQIYFDEENAIPEDDAKRLYEARAQEAKRLFRQAALDREEEAKDAKAR